jgi:hypothetical protein
VAGIFIDALPHFEDARRNARRLSRMTPEMADAAARTQRATMPVVSPGPGDPSDNVLAQVDGPTP